MGSLGYSNGYKLVSHFSVSAIGLTSEYFSLNVSLYGAENFFYQCRNGKIIQSYWPDSLDLIVRYRRLFSKYIINAEIHPLKKIPLSFKIEGSLWAEKSVSNWIESEIISKDPYKFYDYAVYELYPASYKKLAMVLSLFRILNSEIIRRLVI